MGNKSSSGRYSVGNSTTCNQGEHVTILKVTSQNSRTDSLGGSPNDTTNGNSLNANANVITTNGGSSLGVVSNKLSLDRDFTRFLNDPTFPYKVTVCIGDESILCSGVLLGQQSSVLEKKFREDDGVLMFEEMVDVENSNKVLHECIDFLHGADLSFTPENIEVILKFASWYKVESLTEKALHWILTGQLYGDVGMNAIDILHYLKICNHLHTEESVKLKESIFSVLDSDGDLFNCELERDSYLGYLVGLKGTDVAKIAVTEPFKSSFFRDWVAFSIENKKFVLENSALFNFKEIFPCGNVFSNFVDLLSDERELMYPDSIKLLLAIQKDYLSKEAHKENSETPIA